MEIVHLILPLLLCLMTAGFTSGKHPKCDDKGDCGNCGGLGGCYDGLCKCYDFGGNGVVPEACKDKKQDKGECADLCKKANEKGKDSKVITTKEAYDCGADKPCYCKFEKKKGSGYDKCSDDCNDKICPDGSEAEKVSCEGITGACTCANKGELSKNCVKDSYCRGLCNVADAAPGKLCESSKGKKSCYCPPK